MTVHIHIFDHAWNFLPLNLMSLWLQTQNHRALYLYRIERNRSTQMVAMQNHSQTTASLHTERSIPIQVHRIYKLWESKMVVSQLKISILLKKLHVIQTVHKNVKSISTICLLVVLAFHISQDKEVHNVVFHCSQS